jgi:alpha-1,2-mannosyltransferase
MRTLVACAIGFACGIFAFTIAAGIVGSLVAASVIAIIIAAIIAWACRARPFVPIDEAACSRGLRIVALVATVAALVQLTRLAVFMVDPSKPGYSQAPASDWEVRHSCLSAYFVAARAADHVPSIYADSLYTSPDDDPTKVRKALMIGPFKIDVYEYPPPFLLLPRALRTVFPDFFRFRMMWFGLNSAVILLAMLVLARGLGPSAGTRALLLSPLVWAAAPTLSVLQKGNAQALVIAISILAMALFERRRWMAGGALLAYATASKLYPGMLAVYLLARREWRAVAWTAGLGVALAVVTWIDVGWAPFRAVLDRMPALVGGEAFPAFRNPMAMAINYSIPGLVFKLKLFGVPGMTFAAAKVVGWIYTLVVIAVIVAVGRRPVPERRRPLVWLAILILATLRSPFLPQSYAGFPALVLLMLLGTMSAPTTKTLVAVLLAWLALNIMWPIDWPMDPRLLALLSTIPQTVTLALALVALRRSNLESPLAVTT